MHRSLLCTAVWLGLAASCTTDTESTNAPIRLVDVFTVEMVAGRSATPPAPPPRTEWRFENATQTTGFEAFSNVSGLAVRDGFLTGRSTSDLPLLHVESPESLDVADQLHSIEVRLRASAGANFVIAPSADPLPAPEAAPFFMNVFGITTPIVAGEDVQSYTLRSALPIPARRLRHLYIYIRPTDAAGADFAIESIGYERKTSPNLDRMAAEGALFMNNVSQATWTKVSTTKGRVSPRRTFLARRRTSRSTSS